jgi:Cu(I)/Ag(I) efflux system membrane protein CusA/SilA
MTVSVVMLSQAPILRESGIGSDVMKPIAAPIVGGMITSSVHVLILVPVFFAIMKERTLKIDRNVGSGSLSTDCRETVDRPRLLKCIGLKFPR